MIPTGSVSIQLIPHGHCDSIKLYGIIFFNMQKNQPSDTTDCELAMNNTSQEKKL